VSVAAAGFVVVGAPSASAKVRYKQTNLVNCLKNKTVVKRGSRGACVVALQYQLGLKGYTVNVDGVYGPKTRDMVKSYQQYRMRGQGGVDGIVGPATWNHLTNTCVYRSKTACKERIPRTGIAIGR
jgi:peptidoglycan hydrolase-like protein with peptidoglycan-binding domain